MGDLPEIDAAEGFNVAGVRRPFHNLYQIKNTYNVKYICMI